MGTIVCSSLGGIIYFLKYVVFNSDVLKDISKGNSIFGVTVTRYGMFLVSWAWFSIIWEDLLATK